MPPRAIQPRKTAAPRKRKTSPAAGRPPVTPHDISRRAYEIYQSRQEGGGSPLDDWLRAERELSDSAGA